MDELSYYARLESQLPEAAYVQPKLDGSVVCAAWSPVLFVTSDDSSVTNALRQHLQKHVLLDHTLHILQRSNKTFCLLHGKCGKEVLAREALIELSESIGIECIKEQHMSRKRILALLRSLDRVELLEDVRQGLVLITEDRRDDVFCFMFAHLSSTLFQPGWFRDRVIRCESLEEVHQVCERFVGPSDAQARVRQMLVEQLAQVSDRDSNEGDLLFELQKITNFVPDVTTTREQKDWSERRSFT